MASTDVFPPFNLPNEGVPWARAAQNRIVEGEISETQLAQKVDNGLRATSGQLAVLGSQINELTQGRKSFSTSAPNTSFTYAATSGARLIGDVPFFLEPPVGGARSAILMFTYGGRKTAGSNTGFDVWVEVLHRGVVIWRAANRMWVGDGGSIPPGWEYGVSNGSTPLTVLPVGASTEPFAFRFWSYDFQADPGRRVEFNGLTATILYQDLVQ